MLYFWCRWWGDEVEIKCVTFHNFLSVFLFVWKFALESARVGVVGWQISLRNCTEVAWLLKDCRRGWSKKFKIEICIKLSSKPHRNWWPKNAIISLKYHQEKLHHLSQKSAICFNFLIKQISYLIKIKMDSISWKKKEYIIRVIRDYDR